MERSLVFVDAGAGILHDGPPSRSGDDAVQDALIEDGKVAAGIAAERRPVVARRRQDHAVGRWHGPLGKAAGVATRGDDHRRPALARAGQEAIQISGAEKGPGVLHDQTPGRGTMRGDEHEASVRR